MPLIESIGGLRLLRDAIYRKSLGGDRRLPPIDYTIKCRHGTIHLKTLELGTVETVFSKNILFSVME